MPPFRKRPVVISAEQFFAAKRPYPEGVIDLDESPHSLPIIVTPEGVLLVTEGDWIITGVKGEKYPCKPDIFEMTYEACEPSYVGINMSFSRALDCLKNGLAVAREGWNGKGMWLLLTPSSVVPVSKARSGAVLQEANRTEAASVRVNVTVVQCGG